MSGHKSFRHLSERLAATPGARTRWPYEEAILRDILIVSRRRQEQGTNSEAIAGAWEIVRGAGPDCESEAHDYLMTVQEFVTALGGRLEITAVFPDETIALGGPPEAELIE